jgi:hypothetical protein
MLIAPMTISFQRKTFPMIYERIARTPGVAPFGYIQASDDPRFLDPVPHELDCLALAYAYIDKGFSLRQVACWLHAKTGRRLSHVRLSKKYKASKRVKLAKRLTLSEAQSLGIVA